MSEKTDLEKSAVIEFCKAYNKQYPGRLTYVEQCQPPFPDTRCTLSGQDIYIEVAHLYGPTSDAKRLLGREGHSYPSSADQKQVRLTPLNIRIGRKFLETLQDKCDKTYKTDLAWLLIRNANPLWTYSDFQSYLVDIKIPSRHPFQRMWLLCGRGEDSGIIDLSHLVRKRERSRKRDS